MTKNKIALYVHWPFCQVRCGYCDFRTFPYQEKRIPAYTRALQTELKLWSEELQRPVLQSLYFGGGTPSHIPLPYLKQVVQTIEAHFQVPDTIEKTMEMNPEDVSPKTVTGIRELGFQRVSLGIQTFDPKIARAIGRGHSREMARMAIRCLHEAGIHNLSVDLMTGLPGQTTATLAEDFREIAPLPIQHLSLYTLTLAPGTYLHRKYQEDPSGFPDEGEERRLFHFAARRAEALGYERYEIANFAKPGMQSLHNLAYWHLSDYIGAGLSAASFFQGTHERNTDSLREYLSLLAEDKRPTLERETLSPDEYLSELLLTGLRLREGIDFSVIAKRTGVELGKEKQSTLQALIENGYLRSTKKGVAVTAPGADILDTIIVNLMTE